MLKIVNGLSDSPGWSVSFSAVDALGTKRTRTISGINLVNIDVSNDAPDSTETSYGVATNTGYAPDEVESFVQSVATLLGETYRQATLVGKFLIA